MSISPPLTRRRRHFRQEDRRESSRRLTMRHLKRRTQLGTELDTELSTKQKWAVELMMPTTMRIDESNGSGHISTFHPRRTSPFADPSNPEAGVLFALYRCTTLTSDPISCSTLTLQMRSTPQEGGSDSKSVTQCLTVDNSILDNPPIPHGPRKLRPYCFGTYVHFAAPCKGSSAHHVHAWGQSSCTTFLRCKRTVNSNQCLPLKSSRKRRWLSTRKGPLLPRRSILRTNIAVLPYTRTLAPRSHVD